VANFLPVTIRFLDEKGKEIFSQIVPFVFEMDVKHLMELAFILSQKTTKNPDPIRYTMQYYGYSEMAGFPGYLGYELETVQVDGFGSYVPDKTHYWRLSVDGVVMATSGADTTHPDQGSVVVWQFVDTAVTPPSPRAVAIQSRRSSTAPAVPLTPK